MPSYVIEMQHDESSFTALSKMQYDLFCQSNRVTRALLSFGLLILAVTRMDQWWAYLLILYAVYLTSSTRMTATRAARKLVEQIEKSGMGYPASRLQFEEDGLRVTPLPEDSENEDATLAYQAVYRLAEDGSYYYIFRDRFGGYMVPKQALGEEGEAFRRFLEKQTGQTCYKGVSPLSKLLSVRRRKRGDEAAP